jgi:N-acetylglucosamine-6-phosphate deacetylase
MSTLLTARELHTESGRINWPIISVEQGLILSVDAGEPNGSTESLTAAFFDIHVHGAVSLDFMRASPTEIATAGRFLAAHGVGHYLPTTVTAPIDSTLRALERLADAIEAGPVPRAAVPVGIHLEGPFVSHAKRGVHPSASIQPPDIAIFERFHQAARGHIRLITIAPEVPGAVELIAHATALGIRVSLGHSDATAVQATAGIHAGATSATHTFNAMRALNHREPGILGVVLDCSDLYAELICDGVHVDPAMVRLWLRMKGPERAILVTDGMAATGMPDGEYDLGGIAVTVHDGVCLAGQTLAGSVLTMDKAVDNLRRFTNSPLVTAVQLASQNPARMLGLSELTSLAPGSSAHFNIFDETGHRIGSYLSGHRIV